MKNTMYSNRNCRINPGITFIVALLLNVIVAASAFAQQPGELDPTFSGDGKLIDWEGLGGPVAVQPDFRIVVAGLSYEDGNFMVVRYDPDGSRDTTFGSGSGKVMTHIATGFAATALMLQPNGKIIAVGGSIDYNWGDGVNYVAVVRYNSDGSLDTSFGGDGIVTTVTGKGFSSASSVAIQPDGKLVVGLSSDTGGVLVRYNSNGSLDTTFGSNGTVTTEGFGVSTVLLQPDQRIVIVGRYQFAPGAFAMARYNSLGSLDTSFGTGGIVTTPITGYDYAGASCGALQPDGRIVAAGTANENGRGLDFTLVRYDPDGSLDTTFGSNGIVTTAVGPDSEIASIALQSDGKILTAGGTTYAFANTPNDFALVRYNTNGALDSTFGGGDGIKTLDFGDNFADSAYDLALDPRWTRGRFGWREYSREQPPFRDRPISP